MPISYCCYSRCRLVVTNDYSVDLPFVDTFELLFIMLHATPAFVLCCYDFTDVRSARSRWWNYLD